MRTDGRIWCTDVDRNAIRSEQHFQRLLATGAYGFSAASERDARDLLALLDACKPYADYLVAYEGPVHSRIMHPNFAVAFAGTAAGVRSFREAIASGANALLSARSMARAITAYMRGLTERHRRGFPLFMVRGVLAFDYLSEADVAAFQRYFETSAAFAEMRLRGARLPLLVCRRGSAIGAMSATPFDLLTAA